ncbi:hypothetical protein ACLB2K_066759 [Fragaria x ananassa]
MHDQVQAPIAQAEIEEVTEKNIKGQVEVNGQVEGNDEPGVKSTLIFKCLEEMKVNEVAEKKTSTKRRRCEPKSTQLEEVFGQEIAKTDCKAAEEDVTCEEVSVMLVLGSLDNIVATGTSMKTDDPYQLCHGYPLGDQNKPWIFDLDLHRMASMTEIIGNCIVAYQSQHWVLTVVEPEKEKVYYMDPLRRLLPIASAEWKSVINSAILKYNTEKGRPSLNAVAWKNLGIAIEGYCRCGASKL